MPPIIIDRPLVARRLARRAGDGPDFVTALVLDDLSERLLTVSRSFSTALIMAPDGAVLPQSGNSATGGFTFSRASTLLGSPGAPLVDPEHLELPRRDYDLIVSVLDLQAINDIPGFLTRVAAHLVPDGLFLAAALGGATLSELRHAFLLADARLSGGAFGRVAPFIEVRDGGALLQRAGFALPVADVESHVVRYPDALALMGELKKLAASNPLADRPERLASRALVMAAASAYGAHYSDADGRVRASLQILWLSGWAPDPSQQRPLAPGSAQVSLATVLGRTI